MTSRAESADQGETNSTSSRIAVLETRLEEIKDDIEGKEKSLFNRTSKYAGLIALILAIAGGLFTVYDELVSEPRESRKEDQSQLQDIVSQISKINAELTSKLHDFPEEEYAMVSSVWNGAKFTLATRGAELVDRLDWNVDTGTLLVLAYEFQQSQDITKAAEYARRAISRAETDTMRAEATRYLANTSMLQDRAIEARKTYREALGIVAGQSGVQKYWVIGNIYRDWIVFEAMSGHCGEAAELRKVLHTELDSDAASTVLETMDKQMIFLLKQQRACPGVRADWQ